MGNGFTHLDGIPQLVGIVDRRHHQQPTHNLLEITGQLRLYIIVQILKRIETWSKFQPCMHMNKCVCTDT